MRRRCPLRVSVCLRRSVGLRGGAWLLAAGALLPSAALAASTAPKPRPPAPARSRAGHTLYQSPDLWATINVCNSAARPDTVGLRGSMPGSGLANEEMFMRFRLQYLRASGDWHDVGAAADSGFVDVGSSTFKARQAGRDFVLAAPAPGTHYQLRGVITFEWRRHGHVVRHAQKQTDAGHLATAGADPPGYSAGACALG
jgi:hypothetical protein